MTLLPSGLVLTLTALTSLILTPFDFPAARRIGAIDVPKDDRRMHTHPIPRLGGLSIFFAFLILTLIFCFDIALPLFYAWAGAILLVCVGVLDDALSLPPLLKLTAQLGAAYVSTIGGNIISSLSAGGRLVSLGRFALPLTLFWMVTLINAHNFIDGLDGLCGGISLAESAALGLIGLACGLPSFALAAFAVCGACVGFLPYNMGGARIFMGDSGSTFLGFILAWLSVALLSSPMPPSPISMILLFAVPLADIAVAVTRRVAKGKSPFLPDRSHIHHMLADTTLGHFGASRFLRLLAALFAAIAYFIS